MTNRVCTGIAASTAVTTSEAVVASITPSGPSPSTLPVEVTMAIVVTGATNVTAITGKIRRGTTASGTLLNTLVQPVNGAVSQDITLHYLDTAYDGTGYCLTMQATGAAATCGAGTLAAEVVQPPNANL